MLKGVGGFYSVLVSPMVYQCRLRGRLRLDERRVLPGDRVVVSIDSSGQGIVEKILPRQTQLFRPSVANVDQAVIVQAVAEPPPNALLIDRLLVLAEHAGLEAVVVFNKADLGLDSEVSELIGVYRNAGYPVITTSAKTGKGLDDLKQVFAGRVSTLAGPSGVGKSSLINAILPGANLQTGAVSQRLGRGKHTTRHVELLQLAGGGLLADTPGFSQLVLPSDLEKARLQELFIEFRPFAGDCRFTGCLHFKEPDCAVREAVSRGEIAQRRYDNYLVLLEELLDNEQNRY